MIRGAAIISTALCLSMLGCREQGGEPDWKTVPSGQYLLGSREKGAAYAPFQCELKRFEISATEIGTRLFCRYLNDRDPADWTGHPQIVCRDGKYVPRPDAEDKPVGHVSYYDAVRFCKWYAEEIGSTVRLPTSREWEAAARGGITGARYPWGWGAPQGRANYAGKAVCSAARYSANGYGLYDMAGNLFEWCRADGPEAAPIRGGSWAEKDPDVLRVFYEDSIDPQYRGGDVGFRIVREIEKGE